MGSSTIPQMTDPMGCSWSQPPTESIIIDNDHALMTEQVFNALKEYSSSIPSGTYEGKMWKMQHGGKWFLRWYEATDEFSKVAIKSREIIKDTPND
jgi:hypothetical protein